MVFPLCLLLVVVLVVPRILIVVIVIVIFVRVIAPMWDGLSRVIGLAMRTELIASVEK
jgi:hypothetical protein